MSVQLWAFVSYFQTSPFSMTFGPAWSPMVRYRMPLLLIAAFCGLRVASGFLLRLPQLAAGLPGRKCPRRAPSVDWYKPRRPGRPHRRAPVKRSNSTTQARLPLSTDRKGRRLRPAPAPSSLFHSRSAVSRRTARRSERIHRQPLASAGRWYWIQRRGYWRRQR